MENLLFSIFILPTFAMMKQEIYKKSFEKYESIVYKNTSLPPNYTIWGKVIKGLEIIQAIAKEGVVDNKSDGTPKISIAIEKAKVR